MLCVDCVASLGGQGALINAGLPWRLQLQAYTLGPHSDQSSEFQGFSFLHQNILCLFTYLFFLKKSWYIRRSRMQVKLTDPRRCSSSAASRSLQKQHPGFKLAWGLLIIHPASSLERATAEAQDAYRKMKDSCNDYMSFSIPGELSNSSS